MTREKILLDTDIGGDIDDAVCLAYLLREPRCELMGITTVCGDPELRAAVADALCRAEGREIPIVAGTDRTLSPVPVYPRPEGAGALARWPHRDFAKRDAPAFLYERISDHPGQVTLVSVGNMTNIAELFLRHPDAAGLLKGMYVMNGYFGTLPLPSPDHNWNAWADPRASEIALAARVPMLRLFPLEVTRQLTLDAADVANLPLRGGDRLLRAVRDFGSAWLMSQGKLTLHDPLAAASVFDDGLCRFERGRVRVETRDEARFGETRFTPDREGNVELARSVDSARFYGSLFAALGGPSRKQGGMPE